MQQSAHRGNDRKRLDTSNLIAGLFFVSTGVAFGATALWKLDLGSAFQMGPGYFPVVLSALMIVLGFAVAASGADPAPDEVRHPVPWRGLILIGTAPIVFAVVVVFLGLAPAIATIVGLVTYASRRATPKLALTMMLGVTALSVAVFKFGLGISAPLFILGPGG